MGITGQEVCERDWKPAWASRRNGEPALTTVDVDGELVARFQRGEMTAFDSLFAKHQDYVYHIVYGIVGSAEEARDLTQDVFLQVYRSLPKFRRGARFATWLYRIAVNRAVDAARGSRRWRFLPLLEEPSLLHRAADASEEPEAQFEQKMERSEIQTLLMRCSLAHRQCIGAALLPGFVPGRDRRNDGLFAVRRQSAPASRPDCIQGVLRGRTWNARRNCAGRGGRGKARYEQAGRSDCPVGQGRNGGRSCRSIRALTKSIGASRLPP